MSSTRRFIRSFHHIPTELFRVNRTATIHLRAKPGPSRPRTIFDLLTLDGKVQPKALNPATYECKTGPNGASMRPNSRGQQNLVQNIRGNVIIFAVPAGIVLPDDLIIVHEFGDHYSLQARREMTVEELNHKITAFLGTYGTQYTRDEWLQQYSQATE